MLQGSSKKQYLVWLEEIKPAVSVAFVRILPISNVYKAASGAQFQTLTVEHCHWSWGNNVSSERTVLWLDGDCGTVSSRISEIGRASKII